MPSRSPFPPSPRVTPARSVAIFIACVSLMAWVRLFLSGDRVAPLAYGAPLLICIWYRDRRLLWAQVAVYPVMAAYKVFVMTPGAMDAPWPAVRLWCVQVLNMLIVAVVVDLVGKLTGRLRAANAELDETNQELALQSERVRQQNEELQTQYEELAHQNEEIQQQAEELQHQSTELRAQNVELEVLSQERARRQAMIETLLGSLPLPADQSIAPQGICQPLMELFDGTAHAVVVLERQGDEFVVVAQGGQIGLQAMRWPVRNSFGAIVLEHDRTAFVADLSKRPDLESGLRLGQPCQSVIGTPLRWGGRTVGLLKVYSLPPREWTADEFRIVEWAAQQCSLLMEIRTLHGGLRRQNADLEHAVALRTAELQSLVQELEHFSYTITHDMRAPLRAMQGYAQMMSEDCGPTLTEQGRNYLQRISTAARRMDRLITDALAFSKVLQHELPIAPVDSASLIQGMIDSYPMFQPPRARIEIQGEIPLLLANEAGLTQCLSNLLGNAVKFVDKSCVPEVKIGADRRDGVVRLWVQDNGIGISHDMQSRVFGMFQRASKDYEGTGIGLALVQKIAQRMGGTVGVESEPGRGSRFWLELRAA